MALGAAEVALSRQPFAQRESSRRIKRGKALGLFERGARMIGLSQAIVSEPQIVRDFRVGSIAGVHRLQILLRLCETKERSRQPPSRLLCFEAVRKLCERFLVGFEGTQVSTVQLIVFAQLNPVIDGSLVGIGSAVRRLRANVNL